MESRAVILQHSRKFVYTKRNDVTQTIHANTEFCGTAPKNVFTNSKFTRCGRNAGTTSATEKCSHNREMGHSGKMFCPFTGAFIYGPRLCNLRIMGVFLTPATPHVLLVVKWSPMWSHTYPFMAPMWRSRYAHVWVYLCPCKTYVKRPFMNLRGSAYMVP